MTSPKVYNPQGDVFARWMMANPPRTHNGDTRAVDAAPRDTAALAEHFIDLPLSDLRTGWPACLLDAMASGITLGAMARAVTVVSRRLYGVSVDPKSGRVIGDLLAPAQAPTPSSSPQRPPLAPSRSRRERSGRLSDETVRNIRGAGARGASIAEIAVRFGTNKATVSRICNGMAYQEVK